MLKAVTRNAAQRSPAEAGFTKPSIFNL